MIFWCEQVALYSLFDHFEFTLVLIFTCWLELVPSLVQLGCWLDPSWVQVAPSWYQDRTKRAHKQIIHIFTAPPKGPQPANIAGGRDEEGMRKGWAGVKEATRSQQGWPWCRSDAHFWYIFGMFSIDRITSTSLWLWRPRFLEIHIFPMDFDDFLMWTSRSILTF